MNRPADSQAPSGKTSPEQGAASTSNTSDKFSLRKSYLTRYNAFSGMFWAMILFRTISTLVQGGGSLGVFAQINGWVRWTQTLALFEVLHSLTGLVRAPVLTTAMQVASRLLLVWGIAFPFPSTVATSPAYPSMLIAWSLTEVVRYSYFAIQLSSGVVPGALLWLRYNTFFVLYPLGIASECWLVYSCLGRAGAVSDYFGWALVAVLGIYPPGAYVLFTHMMAQRRKVMRAARQAVAVDGGKTTDKQEKKKR